MRLDSANRSFFTLASTALVPYVLLGVFGCGVLSLAAYRVAAEGLGGLQRDGEDLRPAVVFFALVTAGTVVAAVSVRRQLRATRALDAFLRGRRAQAAPELLAAAQRAGLAGRVELVDDAETFSFTYGLLSPRVVVSRGLAMVLSPDQLEAVLHHERYHVRNWDTVKVVVARAAPAAFFFLPALGHLRDRYLAGRELAADRKAVAALGARPLAGALYHVLERPAWSEFGAAAALGGSEFLDMRVEQLESGDEPELAPVPRWAWTVTVAGLLTLTGMFAAALNRSGGTVTMMGDPGGGAGSAVLGILGGVVCSVAWVWAGVVVWRRVIGHNGLTRSTPRSTNQS
ncbi:MAG TPA: M56 family metallopeptidase [Acidimicrobiales bacterium]|nr:M56 family metallopeptidase [Acidimicrobiales bacterium]